MPIYNLGDGPLFVYYDDRTVSQIDYLLSKALIKAEDKDTLTGLSYSFNWCTQRMLNLLNSQSDVRFFQTIFLLHEFSSPYTITQPLKSPVSGISNWDYGVYRRVLKLCLEQACDLKLFSKDPFSFSYIEIIEPVLCELIYLGSLAYFFSSALTEEKLFPKSFSLTFIQGKYNFVRSYDSQLKAYQLMTYVKNYKTDVYDKSCVGNFIAAVKTCFGIEFDKIIATIILLHDDYKDLGGQLLLFKLDVYLKIMEDVHKIPYEMGALFLKGLILSKENKLPLEQSIIHSDKLNRYLYRPILSLDVNNEEFVLIGHETFDQSILSLCSNAFPWRKYPIEWKNSCFVAFIENIANNNDKILEDAIERTLRKNNILYDRNVKNLKKKNNRNLSISSSPGEIDFLFIYKKVLYLAESKNQGMRFDNNNFKHDHSYFQKVYNKKLSAKIEFLNSNLNALEEHFQTINKGIIIKEQIERIEGIFIVNTPTSSMFNNEHPVFGLPQFERYLNENLDLEKIIELDLNLF